MRLPIANKQQAFAQARTLLSQYRGRFILITALLSAAALCQLAIPYLLGRVIDRIGNGLEAVNLLQFGIALVALMLTNMALEFFGNLLATRNGEDIYAQLRESVITDVLRMPISVVESAGSGDLVGRTVTDVNNSSYLIRVGIPSMLVAAVTAIATVGAGIVVAWPLAIGLILGVLPVIVMVRWYQPQATKCYRALQALEAQVSGTVSETLEQAETVDALALANWRESVTDTHLGECTMIERHAAKLRSSLAAVLAISTLIGPITVLILGAILVPRSVVTIGQVATLTLYAWRMKAPLDSLLYWYDILQEALAALARIFGVSLVRDQRQIGSQVPAHQEIEIKDLHFAYPGGADVLRGLDLQINPGERLAIVGVSGAGKTTLARLLAGIYLPDQGSVKIGGVEVGSLPEARIQQEVALINQEHHLFIGTVAENLRYGAAAATDQQLWQALEHVGADSWVRELDQGLETEVGSGARELSEVQVQQLALARVILLDPHTLILDEATSLLDPTSARLMEQSLARLLRGRTVIAIAHRLFTAHDADRIAVMEAGRIVELGAHEQLVAAGGEYAQLWKVWQHC